MISIFCVCLCMSNACKVSLINNELDVIINIRTYIHIYSTYTYLHVYILIHVHIRIYIYVYISGLGRARHGHAKTGISTRHGPPNRDTALSTPTRHEHANTARTNTPNTGEAQHGQHGQGQLGHQGTHKYEHSDRLGTDGAAQTTPWATQQTCLLFDTGDMAALGHSRQVCCATR